MTAVPLAAAPRRHPAAWPLLGCLGGLICLAMVCELADISYFRTAQLGGRTFRYGQQQDQQQQQREQWHRSQQQHGAEQEQQGQHAQEEQAFKFAYATFVASNSSRYIKWASLQHLAARRFVPDATHIIYVAAGVDKVVSTALQSLGAKVELIEPFPEQHQHGGTWINQLTKIKLWSQVQYDMLCYLDSDVIFFSNITSYLVDECRPKLFDPANPVDICGYENESCEPEPMNMWNRNHWGMPYMEASLICLRPNMTLYNSLLKGGVERLQREESITMNGITVHTEQDFLNMFFKGRIHYFPCNHTTGGRANGTIVHTKDIEGTWRHHMGSLPLELFVEK